MNEKTGLFGYIALIVTALMYCASNYTASSSISMVGASVMLMLSFCIGAFAYTEYFNENK